MLTIMSLVPAMQDLLTSVEEEDTEKFTNTVAEYDSMTRLDAWYTTMLLRAKKQLQACCMYKYSTQTDIYVRMWVDLFVKTRTPMGMP